MSEVKLPKVKDFKNPDGLPNNLLEELVKPAGGLIPDKPDPIMADVLHYLVDGESSSVLLTIGGMVLPCKDLALHRADLGTYSGDKLRERRRAGRRTLFSWIPPSATGFFERLGEFFEAASQSTKIVFNRPSGWPVWLLALLWELVDSSCTNGYDFSQYYYGNNVGTINLDTLAAIFRFANVPEEAIIEYFIPPTNFLATTPRTTNSNLHPFRAFKEPNIFLVRHTGLVAKTLANASGKEALAIMEILTHISFDFNTILPSLSVAATSSSKTLRELCFSHVLKHSKAITPELTRLAREGDAGQRGEAVLLLSKLDTPGMQALLENLQTSEKSDRVKQTIEKALSALQSQSEASSEDFENLSPLSVELGIQPLPESIQKALRSLATQRYEAAKKAREDALALKKAGGENSQWIQVPQEFEPFTDGRLQLLIDLLEGKIKEFKIQPKENYFYEWRGSIFGDWLSPPDLKLIHLVRLLFALGYINEHSLNIRWHNIQPLEIYRSRCHPPFGLRELSACVGTLPKVSPDSVCEQYLVGNNQYIQFCPWETEAIWPAFAERIDYLKSILTNENKGGSEYIWPERRKAAIKVVAKFPHVPASLVPILWDIALGDAKSERPEAQDALAKLPNKTAQVIKSLADGKQTIRVVAAEWLGDIGDKSAIEPLKEAFRKEKQEIAKGAIMQALDRLGADVNEFLNRDQLKKEAKIGLSKKLPAGMEWVPLDRLPKLHWSDNGNAVDDDIVKWWVVQCIAQKLPSCGPILRRYLSMVKPSEAANFGRFLLANWIAQDTQSPSAEEAAAEAEKMTAHLWNQKYIQDHFKTRENLYANHLTAAQGKFLTSAIAQKGLLAIPAAVGDGDCAKLAEKYIRTYFGNRLAQCKALVEMLSWIKHPLALQVLLSLANRFRTKAVRQLAAEIVQQVADREGWTIDELADRTIPSAGFARAEDEEGNPIGTEAILTLDFGPRQFRVTLNDDLEPVIVNEEGKTVKALPAPAKADDEEKAKNAKKLFSDAKKQVKDVVKRQKERLYEALCTQRSWSFANWKRYLADHPIVGRLCVQLVWAATKDDKLIDCFRPLEDGTLTNEKDDAVTIDDDATITLAHTATVPSKMDVAWAQHLKDYDIEPCFPQFGRGIYTLPQEKQKGTEVKDFEGYAMTNFQLRGKITKLGYIRGEAEDGGVFMLYRKPFPSLKIDAEIHFSGSGLPETDGPIVLYHLCFAHQKLEGQTYSWNANYLVLSKVPGVLLSECYNDLKQLASEGSGFKADWKKVGFY